MTNATEDENREPTMEEILASIRRIISDGEEKGGGEGDDEAPEEEPADGGDDVLELTEVAPDIEDALDLEPELDPSLQNAVEGEGDPIPENDFDSIEVEKSASAPVAVAVASAPVASPAVDLHTLLSDHAADVTTETFSGLTGAVSAARGMPMGNVHQTLEELIKDLLRPMLKEWLDKNLPTLVERLVEKEIGKLVGRAEKG
jgi:cell pole-organizing protein PopZ